MGTHRIRYLASICGVLLLAVLLMASTGAAQTPSQESITLVLEAPAYRLVPTEGGYTQIEAEGYGIAGEPGRPLLPHRLVDVALPPDVAWDSLSLSLVDLRTTPLPGAFSLREAVPDESANGPAAYLGPAAEPPIAQIVATGQMRKWRLARVDFRPFRYDPATGQIQIVEQVTVELRFARTGEATDAALLADTTLDEAAAERLINYEQALAWYPPAKQAPMATYNYVIITTNAIETNSTKLANFVAHKQAKGFSVLVVTEDDYGGLTGQPPNGREEKVRQWLMNNYVAYSIKYVLLIGNPTPAGSGTTAVPMKMCWPRQGSGSDEESPTDYFFADLTGDWNKDGDSYFGEYTGDWGVSGGVDFMPEVYVGRIPFYGTYADLDGILQKTMDYGNATNIGWRSSILLPMSFSAAGYDGAPLAQQMWDDYLNGAGYGRWRQYQQGNGACGPDSSYASDEELRGGTVVRDRWAANDYGIVCWWGHGSAAAASVGYDGCWDGTLFDNSQTASLDDSHPSFVYQCSCLNGYPENTGNLQYTVLKRGGIATVSASRVSWFNTGVGYGDFDGSTTNSGIGYEYTERIVAGLTASEALYGATSSMTPESNTRLMNFYDFNLYGDPAIKITSSGTPAASRVYLPLVFKGYIPGEGCGLPIHEGFEAGVVPPTGWTRIQTNPRQTWKIQVVGLPYSGSHAADVEYDDQLAQQDEVLLSPEFAPSSVQLNFYSKGSLYWCRDDNDNCDLNIWLVVGNWGGGDDIYVGKADDSWTATWEWSLTSIDLTPYLPLGTPVRVAFQYYGQDGAQIALDDVSIYGTCVGECPIDSSFNGSAPNWYSHSGTWYIGSEYLYTYGVANACSSASYAADFRNFDYQASMIRYGCDTCSNRIIIRGDPDPLDAEYYWDSAYLFQYTRSGDYSVFKRVAGGDHVALASWTYSSAINQGDAWNTLRVVANGANLSYYINGTLVWSGPDPDLSTGRAGLGMYQNDSSGNELRVDWAKLCSLPAGVAYPLEPSPAGEGVTADGDVNGVFH
jgi:hypothetical protein